MAYMNQERKKELAPGIKVVLKKYGMKGTIATRHRSTLVVNIKSGRMDVIGNYCQNMKDSHFRNEQEKEESIRRFINDGYIGVNVYWIDKHYTGEVRDFLNELHAAMMVGNWNNSDVMTDYFDVGWYTDINIGQWDKPYVLEN